MRRDRPLSTELVTTDAAPPRPAREAPIIDVDLAAPASRRLRDYPWVLYKYRWLVGACFGATVALALLAIILTPRVYTATARLQVARQSPIHLRLQENVLRVDEGEAANGPTTFLATQVSALESRDLGERVIADHRLFEDEAFLHPGPARAGLVSVGGHLLRLLRPRGWPAPAADEVPAREAGATVDPELIDRYMRYLDVRDVRGTDLVDVRFTTPSPQLSAFLAAAHVQAYLEANEDARLETTLTAKDFLGRQLRDAETQLERADAALAQFATEHPNVAVNEEQKVAVQRIAELSSLLTKAEGARIALETRHEFLARPDADPMAHFLDRPGVSKLAATLLEHRSENAALATRLGPNHPQMVERRREEAELEQQLHAAVVQEVAGVRSRLEAAKLREEGLRHKLAYQEEATIALRELGSQYALKKNDADIARALHQSLLKQQLETAVNSELAASNVRVLERPEVPRRPSAPNVPLNLTLAVVGGLCFAAGTAFLCEHHDSSVKSSEDVESFVGIPTLATVPNFAIARRAASRGAGGRLERNGAANGNGHAPAPEAPAVDLVVVSEPRSASAEAFRNLRAALLFSVAGAPPRVVLVTSASAGEGKTVSALNLAGALAAAGSRVLLIDADLRRPACHRVLGVPNEIGLSSFLSGQVDLASVIRPNATLGLDFLAAGPPPPGPAELIGSAVMRTALEQLEEAYDFVVVDSPPVLPVADATALACWVDGVVLVIKGHDTPREMVRRARNQLLQAGAHLLGAVVNNVDRGWGDLYFYGRYYDYDAPPPGAALRV